MPFGNLGLLASHLFIFAENPPKPWEFSGFGPLSPAIVDAIWAYINCIYIKYSFFRWMFIGTGTFKLNPDINKNLWLHLEGPNTHFSIPSPLFSFQGAPPSSINTSVIGLTKPTLMEETAHWPTGGTAPSWSMLQGGRGGGDKTHSRLPYDCANSATWWPLEGSSCVSYVEFFSLVNIFLLYIPKALKQFAHVLVLEHNIKFNTIK